MEADNTLDSVMITLQNYSTNILAEEVILKLSR